jgi:hypothetical protein
VSGQVIVVWFSCGAASAIAAKLTLDRYEATSTVRIVNNPIAEEDHDNQRFLRDVEAWLGHQIESVVNPRYPNASCVEVWERERYMSGVNGAKCTVELKKKARQVWEKHNHHDWLVMGFTVEERKRFDLFAKFERGNILPVLIDAGLTKQDCLDLILRAGIKPPAVYGRGYPNANCIGCVKATSPTYWNHVRRDSPAVFWNRARQSRRLGVRLVRYNGERIYLDELPPDAVGKPLASLSVDCGIFCEESS